MQPFGLRRRTASAPARASAARADKKKRNESHKFIRLAPRWTGRRATTSPSRETTRDDTRQYESEINILKIASNSLRNTVLIDIALCNAVINFPKGDREISTCVPVLVSCINFYVSSYTSRSLIVINYNNH